MSHLRNIQDPYWPTRCTGAPQKPRSQSKAVPAAPPAPWQGQGMCGAFLCCQVKTTTVQDMCSADSYSQQPDVETHLEINPAGVNLQLCLQHLRDSSRYLPRSTSNSWQCQLEDSNKQVCLSKCTEPWSILSAVTQPSAGIQPSYAVVVGSWQPALLLTDHPACVYLVEVYCATVDPPACSCLPRLPQC